MPLPRPTTCPHCGTEDDVTGRVDDHTGEVELTCGGCGRSWWRGERRCASCGGHDLTTRPQVMRRHSRGNQLSIMGWRDVTLCRACDAAVLDTTRDDHTPIPEEYVSAALIDVNAAPAPPPSPPPAVRPRSSPATKPPSRAAPSPRPPSRPPEPAPPRPPTTVRQALERSQTTLAADGAALDPTVVLLLGQRLGPATRLDGLTAAGHDPASLRAWAEGLWGTGAGAASARRTLTALADHWQRERWTTTDMAAELRPQEDA